MIAVIIPLEKMLTFADAADVRRRTDRAFPDSVAAAGRRLGLARYTFVLDPSPRPTVFLAWLIVPGIVYACGAAKTAAVQALMLLLAAIGIDALGVRRGLKPNISSSPIP